MVLCYVKVRFGWNGIVQGKKNLYREHEDEHEYRWQGEERGRRHTFIYLDVDRPPPDIVLARLLKHNPLVFRATTRLLTGKVDESTRGGDDSPFVADGIFVELSWRSVALHVDLVHVEAGLREVFEVAADDCGHTTFEIVSNSDERIIRARMRGKEK